MWAGKLSQQQALGHARLLVLDGSSTDPVGKMLQGSSTNTALQQNSSMLPKGRGMEIALAESRCAMSDQALPCSLNGQQLPYLCGASTTAGPSTRSLPVVKNRSLMLVQMQASPIIPVGSVTELEWPPHAKP